MSWAGYGETSKTCETGETGETGRRFHHPRHPRSKTRSESGGPSAVGRHNIVRGWQPQLHRKRVIRVDLCASVVAPRGAIRERGHSCLLVSLRGLPGLVRVFRAFRGRPCGASRKSLRRYAQRHRPGSPDPSYRCTAFIRVDPCASVVAPRGASREHIHSCPLVSLRGWSASSVFSVPSVGHATVSWYLAFRGSLDRESAAIADPSSFARS